MPRRDWLIVSSKPKQHGFKDIDGRVFGRLTVLGYAGIAGTKNRGAALWYCQCVCGRLTRPAANKLKSGSTVSCGCHAAEVRQIKNTKHGKAATGRSRSAEYAAYYHALGRCYRVNDAGYPSYGGRGITVCERWRRGDGILSGFECFFSDLGERPSPGHSLDRRDVNGNYEPGNCRWATKIEQARNRRNNHLVTVGDRNLSIAEACQVLSLRYGMVITRVKRGVPFDLAIVGAGQ